MFLSRQRQPLTLPLVLAWVLLLAGFSASAAQYFVSTSGSDSNPGTQSLPWRTIQKAADTMVAGDTCVVSSGVYPERVITRRDGTSAAFITFRANGQVTMNGFQVNHDYNRIDGFQVTGTPTAQFNGSFNFGPSASYSEVINCRIYDTTDKIGAFNFYKGGNLAGQSADHCLIRGNIIQNVNYHCVIFYGLGHLMENNVFDNNNGYDAIRIFGGDHVIRGNTFNNISSKEGVGNHPDIIQTFGSNGDECFNILFENNFIKDSVTQLMQLVQGDGQSEDSIVENIRNWTFRNNVFLNVGYQANISIPEVKFYNNTFVNCTRNTGHVLNFSAIPNRGYAHNCEVFNNLFIGCGVDPTNPSRGWYAAGDGVLNFRADYNYVAGPAPDYPRKQTTSTDPRYAFTEPHGINGGNPMFRSETDLHLMTGSPAIGAALAIGTFSHDLEGKIRTIPWDMGAYKYTVGSTLIDPPQNLRIVQ